jgi:hypothetical protein
MRERRECVEESVDRHLHERKAIFLSFFLGCSDKVFLREFFLGRLFVCGRHGIIVTKAAYIEVEKSRSKVFYII